MNGYLILYDSLSQQWPVVIKEEKLCGKGQYYLQACDPCSESLFISSHNSYSGLSLERMANTMRIAVEELFVVFFMANVLMFCVSFATGKQNMSAVGDPGMARDGLRVALEAWNFCNEVGSEAPGMGSPRAADCFDLSSKLNHKRIKRVKRSGRSLFYLSPASDQQNLHFFFLSLIKFTVFSKEYLSKCLHY